MWLTILVLLFTVLFYLIRRHLQFWKRQGVPGPTPLPLVGNIGKNLIGLKTLQDVITDIYNEFEGYPFLGIYRGTTPCLLVRDPEFVKDITVKHFKCFQDNDFDIDKEIDPLFGRNPFVLNGEEWRKSRSQLTPCFTSGKMKHVFPLVEEVSKRMVKFVENELNRDSSISFEAKELCSKFTLDNVAACAFGVEGKCFEDDKSHFRDLAHKFFSPSAVDGIKLLILFIVPQLMSFFSVKFVPKDVEDQLTAIVQETIKYRKENNIVRNDFLDFMIQLSKTSANLTEVDIVAHATSFFIDGFETSALVMSLVLFNLADNPDAQAKLRTEINASFQKNNDQLSYESIQELAYLDACLNETLRKYPPLPSLIKKCTEKYVYTPTNPDYKSISVTIQPGTSIVIPVVSMQMDPKYYPSPEKFIPERFLEEKINKYTYMPFGEGPRACLGQRFGIMQVKTGIAHLVKNFEITMNEKTKLPLTFDPWNFLLSPKGGVWLNLRKI